MNEQASEARERRRALLDLLAAAEEVGETGLWVVLTHDPRVGQYRAQGPYCRGCAQRAADRLRAQYAATVDLPGDDSLADVRVRLARFDAANSHVCRTGRCGTPAAASGGPR